MEFGEWNIGPVELGLKKPPRGSSAARLSGNQGVCRGCLVLAKSFVLNIPSAIQELSLAATTI